MGFNSNPKDVNPKRLLGKSDNTDNTTPYIKTRKMHKPVLFRLFSIVQTKWIQVPIGLFALFQGIDYIDTNMIDLPFIGDANPPIQKSVSGKPQTKSSDLPAPSKVVGTVSQEDFDYLLELSQGDKFIHKSDIAPYCKAAQAAMPKEGTASIDALNERLDLVAQGLVPTIRMNWNTNYRCQVPTSTSNR